MTLDLESGVQLAATGNTRAFEEQWMAALERHAADPHQVASWAVMLDEFAKRERYAEAEPLAWAAVEAVLERAGPEAAVQVASAFLLALNRSTELKSQVTELYRTAYADRPGIEALLQEAGVAGGRPPRRALRTMEVCLGLKPGDFLVGRHEDSVVQVERIDHTTWEITVSGVDGDQTYGPVQLADEFQPVAPEDFRVLRRRDPERLRAQLAEQPAEVVTDILRAHDGRMDSDALRNLLCPDLIPAKEWSKWWTKARTALKRHPNVTIEGRTPCEISYSHQCVTLETETEAAFKKLAKPQDQLGAIEYYLRECRTASSQPDTAMLERFRSAIEKSCRRQMNAHAPTTLGSLLVLRNMAKLLGAEEKDVEGTVIEFLKNTPDPVPYVQAIDNEELWPVACQYIRSAYPDSYVAFFATLLPEAPTGACDIIARDLAEAGWDAERFNALVQRILKEPVRCVDALVWLWLGPSISEPSGGAEPLLIRPPDTTLCSRLLWAAGEIRRDHEAERDMRKRVANAIRKAFAADDYARFKACLDQASPGLASAWRTQISRLDNVGRALPEDMLNLIRAAFPDLYRTAQLSPWKREDLLYVTAAGRRKFESELDELVNVKMKANAVAIGEAASHGDLSENSEYKFALEERDLLRARQSQMQEQLAMAVVCDPDEVSTREVGFGAQVTFRSSQDPSAAHRVTFLGPWEANADRGIYNYKSPLGQSVMGLAVGETVELPMFEPPGAYVVEKIENALSL